MNFYFMKILFYYLIKWIINYQLKYIDEAMKELIAEILKVSKENAPNRKDTGIKLDKGGAKETKPGAAQNPGSNEQNQSTCCA